MGRLIVAIVFSLFLLSISFAQPPTPTPTPSPLNVNRITITKLRNLPATAEVHTAEGITVTGTGPIEWAPFNCNVVNPCLAGTAFNTQLRTGQFAGTLDGRDIAFYIGNPGWISAVRAWSIPYLYPANRPITRFLSAEMFTTTFAVYEFGQWGNAIYASTVEMTGSIRLQMSPLRRTGYPRPTTEFERLEIELIPRATPSLAGKYNLSFFDLIETFDDERSLPTAMTNSDFKIDV